MSTRAQLAVFGVLGALAVVVWALVPTYPNYDAYYHLVWGRELLDGVTPTFTAYAAPTEHPLYVALAAVLGAVLGTDADRGLVLVGALSLVALVWAVYRLARACFGDWPAAAAAVFVGSSFALLLYAARAYLDVPFLALVFWAGALEAARPARRDPSAGWSGPSGRAPMVLLAVAGLLRPEAWVLAGLYWLWCGWRRWDLLLLAAAAPVVWAGVDWAVTGEPLHSLTATSKLADELGRERGIVHVPGSLVSFLAAVARPPVAVAGLVGMVLAARARRPSLHVPFALFAAGVATFVLTGAAGLSILPRYLTVPAVALCCFAGYATLGFTTLERSSRTRRRWMALVGAGAVLGLVFVAVKISVADRLVTELRFIRSTHTQLAALLDTPQVRAGLRCGPLTFPNYRLVPDARWYLDLPADRVGARSDRRRPYGVAVFMGDEKTLKRYGEADGATRTTNRPDPGFGPAVRDRQFVAYVSCP